MLIQTKTVVMRSVTWRSVRSLLVPLLFGVVLAGCASSQKMFERARQLEDQGDYLAAAREYVDVLERESEWTEARTRLRLVGPLAVDTLLARARAAESASNFPSAVGHLDALDGLRTAASNVGVALDVPDDYAAYREEMVDRAVSYYVDAAREAEATEDWKEGLADYDRALQYAMPAPRRREIEVRKATVHLWWAEDEMEAGRHRGAYGQAEHGLALAGTDAGLADRLAELQDAALHEGSRYVAMLPLIPTVEWERAAPEDLLADIDAALHYEYWTEPPLFIKTIDQGEIRREIRDMGLSRRRLDTKDASRLGRSLDADFVIVGELRRYEEKEDLRDEETERVRLRGRRADTTYVLRTYRVDIEARGRFFLEDPHTGRTITEFDVTATDRGEYKRGTYRGDVATLDLSSRERDYFGPRGRAEAVRDVHDRLLEKLAEQIASRSFDATLRYIP